MVTAELATIAPFAVAFAFLLLWVISLGLTQIRITDASREAARMIARGEPVQDAKEVARKHAPAGAKVSVDTESGTVTVIVTARSRMPLPYFSAIGSQELDSSSVAAVESP
ncbi:TadE family type IV pilus minor pilin [Aeromicrobium sp.]|uniref:TadE family type IV pilus minor pilin n=1 Tax=Aeromicrobium sp. TaxID=1871063 RepID=UPI002FC8B1AA